MSKFEFIFIFHSIVEIEPKYMVLKKGNKFCG